MSSHRVSLVFAAGCLASCGGGAGDDGVVLDPNAIDVLVLSSGMPAAGRDVTLISSDGMVQTVQTDGRGHAVAMLGPDATQATVSSSAMTAEGKHTMQGVVPGDHICLGCTYTTTPCTGLPQVTGVQRSGAGWTWSLSPGGPYAGMEVSWQPMANNPNGAGHLLSPAGATSASTSSSIDITIVLFSRDDVATYDDLRRLSKDGWARTPFCASTTHAP